MTSEYQTSEVPPLPTTTRHGDSSTGGLDLQNQSTASQSSSEPATSIVMGDQQASETASEQMLAHLNGQIVKIPDLWPLFQDWPRGRHPGYLGIKYTLADTLRGFGEKKRKIIAAADPALLAAEFWPESNPKRALILLFYVLWQGFLDEVLESLQDEDETIAHAYRRSLSEFVDDALGLGSAPKTANKGVIIRQFVKIAAALKKRSPRDNVEQLSMALHAYIHSTAAEYRCNGTGAVLPYREYFALRKLTGGTGPLVALSEYASMATLPASMTTSTAWLRIYDAMCVIVGLTNDLFSIKREMYAGSTLNAIAVLSHEEPSRGLDAIVATIIRDISIAVARVEEGEAQLLRSTRDPEEQHAIRQVLRTLKHNCTGNLSWSLATPRYGLDVARDGSVTMQLWTKDRLEEVD